VKNLIFHPPHYIAGRRFEPIDVIEDWNLDFHLAQVLKYVSRAGRKDDSPLLLDLEKARYYLERRINLEKRRKPRKHRKTR